MFHVNSNESYSTRNDDVDNTESNELIASVYTQLVMAPVSGLGYNSTAMVACRNDRF